MELFQDSRIWVHGIPVAVPEGQFAPQQDPHTLLRFRGPIRAEWLAALAERSVRVLFFCPPFGACVLLPAALGPERLPQEFPFLAGAAPYLPEHCRRDLPPPTEEHRCRAGLLEDRVDLVCIDREYRQRVEEQLRALNVPVLDASSSKLRVRYRGDLALLRDLIGVKIADPARAPVPLSAASPPAGLAAALGAATIDGEWRPDLSGAGEIVAVADTGLDGGRDDGSLHPDFRGRVVRLSSWPINPSWADLVAQPGHDDGAADTHHGHGTHVAGVAVGDGSASGGRIRGVAPGARLVLQAIEQYTEVKAEHQAQLKSGYYLSGRPLDLRALFQEARDLGARIHVNAWGDPSAGAYSDDCYEADLFLHENPDALVLFAAGNDGRDTDGDRVPDPSTMNAPAAAKNVVAVGATEGPLRGVGLRGTWASLDAAQERYRNPEDRAQPVSGTPERIALFSSAGPSADGRVKPDLCAPGTNVPGARSSQVPPAEQGWGLADPYPYYMYSGGTSTAAGVAGGVAALLRQAWRQHLGGAAPSGPALKALLVLGAQPVRRRDGAGEELTMVAGFGRLCLAASLPEQAGRRVELHDEIAAGLSTGAERSYPLSLPKGGTLRAVLCWYDAPGERLLNDLDLCLMKGDAPVWGNHAPGQAGQPDRHNTVEVLRIDNLAAGDYVLRVIGANVPVPPQGYALALRTEDPKGGDS